MSAVMERTEAPGALVTHSNATALLQAITTAASNPQVDIEKMERLFAMHQQMVAKEAEAAFNGAMARAQARIEPVANNASNNQTNSRYAKLAAINRDITPIYTAEGLSISFDSGDCPKEGWTRTIAKVSHAEGHTREYHYDLPLDSVGAKGNVNKTEVHAAGSTSSYARRYLVCMIFNVTTEDDDDGNKGGGVAPLSEKQSADFDAAIDSETDAEALANLWKKIVAACNDARDVPAYEAFKKKVEARGKALKAKK